MDCYDYDSELLVAMVTVSPLWSAKRFTRNDNLKKNTILLRLASGLFKFLSSEGHCL